MILRASCVAVASVLIAGCSRQSAPPAPGLGDVMSQVGRRFELAGRAFSAGRYELAQFEIDELGELFEDEVPRARLPNEGPTAHIPAMIAAFRASALPALGQAAASRDPAKFALAFGHAAAQCNECHTASAKAFIQVPAVAGQAVPVMDPLPGPR